MSFDVGGQWRWTGREQRLIEWFEASLLALPSAPLRLRAEAWVSDPERFYRSLQADIERGPAGPRGRFGGLLSDLESLRKVVEG